MGSRACLCRGTMAMREVLFKDLDGVSRLRMLARVALRAIRAAMLITVVCQKVQLRTPGGIHPGVPQMPLPDPNYQISDAQLDLHVFMGMMRN